MTEPTLSDLRRGYSRDDDANRCLYCEARFERGHVYAVGEALLTARRAADAHVQAVHGGPFAALLGQGEHGLSAVHQRFLAESARGASDAELARALGGRSLSTVRNHRFQLRKKVREARAFLALMELLEAPMETENTTLTWHPALPVSDDRTRVTPDEARELLHHYLDPLDPTRLSRIPKKEKHKLVILRWLVQRFEPGARYTERAMNEALARAHPDTAALRRYLVDYRFMARLPDGTAYWRTDADSPEQSLN